MRRALLCLSVLVCLLPAGCGRPAASPRAAVASAVADDRFNEAFWSRLHRERPAEWQACHAFCVEHQAEVPPNCVRLLRSLFYETLESSAAAAEKRLREGASARPGEPRP